MTRGPHRILKGIFLFMVTFSSKVVNPEGGSQSYPCLGASKRIVSFKVKAFEFDYPNSLSLLLGNKSIQLQSLPCGDSIPCQDYIPWGVHPEEKTIPWERPFCERGQPLGWSVPWESPSCRRVHSIEESILQGHSGFPYITPYGIFLRRHILQ